MATKFTRGTYGSVTFTRMGIPVRAFQPDDADLLPEGGWCLQIGRNIYAGFASRRAAVEGVSRFI